MSILLSQQVEFVGLRPGHVDALAQLVDTTDSDLWVVAAVRSWGPERFVATSRAELALGVSLRLAVEYQGRFAGYVALGQLQGGPAQLEFAIAPEYRGRGLAVTAARAIIGHALRRGVAVIESCVRFDNAASIAVLRRSGFTLAAPSRHRANCAIWRWQGDIDGSEV